MEAQSAPAAVAPRRRRISPSNFKSVAGVVALATCLLAPAARAQVATADSLALVAIYNSTNGPNWNKETGWLNGPVSSWGFLTVEANRVTILGLEQLGLTGTLPPEIGDLSELRLLALGFNQITGPLPDEIGNLSKLQKLYIHRNEFSGPIPSSIGRLTELEEFVFWGNQLTELPEEIGNLYRLTSLNGFENKLTAIPMRIGDLINLESIILGSNSFTGGIPATIGNLTKLKELSVEYCPTLTGPIPASIGNLVNLEKLYLYNSGITGPLPDEIGDLVSLERIDISGANLSGPIPASIGGLENLWTINLSNNGLTGSIPGTIGDMPALTELLVWANQLSGTIPANLTNAPELGFLQLNDNQLEGAVPEALTTMEKLYRLNIKNNNIEDLPDFRSHAVDYFYLDLAGNRLAFDDLQRNAGDIRIDSYAPQQEIPVFATDMGTHWVLSCDVGGVGNSYQWFYSDRSAAAPNSQDPKIVVQKPVTRQYYCEAKNSDFVDLILTTGLWPASGSNQAPSAAFEPSATTGSAPLLVEFDASGSSDPDGDTLSFAWDFGDGVSGSGETVSHTFAATGTFSVTLTVTDPDGASDSASGSVTATEASDTIGLWLVGDETGADVSGAGHDGNWIGNPMELTDPDYPSHTDLYLDGYSAVRVPDHPALSPDVLTVIATMRFDNLSALSFPLAHAVTGSSTNGGWFLSRVGTTIGVSLATETGDVALVAPTGSLNAQQWHQIAFTVGGGLARFYLDGIQVAEEASGRIIDPAADLYLGAAEASVATNGGGLTGFLGRVAMYRRVLSAQEIYAQAEVQIGIGGSTIEEGLICWFPFDGSAKDQVSGADPGWTSFGADRNGTPGGALVMDGMTDYVMPVTTGATSSGISVGGWFRLDNVPENDLPMLAEIESPLGVLQDFFLMGSLADEGFYSNFQAAPTWSSLNAWTARMYGPGDWFHLFATHDGTTHTIYVDGVAVSSRDDQPLSDIQVLLEGNTLRFGTRVLTGAVDDFRIYDRALTDQEVLSMVRPETELRSLQQYDPAGGGGVYSAAAGGFVYGTNGYGDLAKAQMFTLPDAASSGSLAGARIWLGHSVERWSMDATVRVWSGTGTSGPQTELFASPALSLSTMEKDYEFEDPAVVGPIPITYVLPNVAVGSTFFVSVHFEPYSAPGDLYAIMAGPPIGAAVPDVWEQDYLGNWGNVSAAWFSPPDGGRLWIDAIEAVSAASTATVTEEGPQPSEIPSNVALYPAYPNPFNPSARLEFDIASSSDVRLAVFDALGREVALLVDGQLEPGRHQVTFDAEGLSSGIYLARLATDQRVSVQTLVLMK
ncbi:MAG: PKD domain-containing protein [Rhodothermales bacterium]|nr:PKD domain-containing protein [Rhodothermales bacterium]